ncbi:hypothetical protein HK102_005363 [Quaeritorhiza haematococci]|nr:hypothetical protein HK102_005363 [Quaeritorhiza haematococci]
MDPSPLPTFKLLPSEIWVQILNNFLPLSCHLTLRQSCRTFCEFVNVESRFFLHTYKSDPNQSLTGLLQQDLPVVTARFLAATVGNVLATKPERNQLVQRGPNFLVWFASLSPTLMPPSTGKPVTSTGALVLFRGQLFKPSSTSSATTQTPLFRLRVSMKAMGTFAINRIHGSRLLAEAVGAPRGDCTTVLARKDNLQTLNQHQNGSTFTNIIYSIPDYSDEPPLRHFLSKDPTSKFLMAYLERDHTIELRFRGGGVDTFAVESYRLQRREGGEGESPFIVDVENVERVDTMELLLPTVDPPNSNGAADSTRTQEGTTGNDVPNVEAEYAATQRKLAGLAKWILDLWHRIEEGEAAVHANLAGKRKSKMGEELSKFMPGRVLNPALNAPPQVCHRNARQQETQKR